MTIGAILFGMCSVANANEVGIASFYWQGQKTASGERFNPNAMTAAHRHYPLNSHIQVTNLSNNKTVILRVNDRGPFVRGRIVDVSRAAASILGFTHRGFTKVKVERIK